MTVDLEQSIIVVSDATQLPHTVVVQDVAIGAKGDKGDAATVAVGTTTTLAAGASATVENVGTQYAAVFNFGIPQGAKGDTGSTGLGVPAGGTVGQIIVKTALGDNLTEWASYALPTVPALADVGKFWKATGDGTYAWATVPSTPPSGVAGAIQFTDGSAFASNATKLFWNDTSKRLGVGTNDPQARLHIVAAVDEGCLVAQTMGLKVNIQEWRISSGATVASVSGTGVFTATNFSGTSSGTNTGDETTATIKTKLGAASATTDGYLTSTDWNTFNSLPSAGILSAPTVTNNGSGSVTIGAITAAFNTTVLFTGNFVSKAVAGATFTLTANTYTYIVADYNSGTPILRATTDNNEVNHSTILNVVQCYWEQTGSINELHYFVTGNYGLGLSNKTSHRLIHTNRFGWESGLTLTSNVAQNILTSSGRIWYDSEEIDLSAADSSVVGQEAHFYYHSAGAWVATKVTTYNNTQYDNGINLVTLNPNRYAVNWVYRSVSENTSTTYYVLGTGDYTLAEAQVTQPPALPLVIVKQAILVGRIIVQKSAATATQIDSAFVSFFSPAASGGAGDGEGSVQFNTAGALAGDSTALKWDAANKRLGVGTGSPAAKVHAASLAVGSIPIIAQGFAAQIADLQQWQDSTSSVKLAITATGRIQSTGVTRTSAGSGESILGITGFTHTSATGTTHAIYALNIDGTHAFDTLNQVGSAIRVNVSSNATTSQIIYPINIRYSAATMAESIIENPSTNAAAGCSLRVSNGALSGNGVAIKINSFDPGSSFRAKGIILQDFNTATLGMWAVGTVDAQYLRFFHNSAASGFGTVDPTMFIRDKRIGMGQYTAFAPAATLHIKGEGATSATTALLVRNSGNTDLFSVKDDGSILHNAALATAVPLTVKGAAAQSASLQEWQTSSGTVLAKVDANGDVNISRASAGIVKLELINTELTDSRARVYFMIGSNTSGADYGIMQHYGPNYTTLRSAMANSTQFSGADTNGFNITSFGGTGQTGGTIRFWTSPNGTNNEIECGRFDLNQRLSLGNTTGGAKLHVQSTATGEITGIIQAFSAQTADLLQWQDSTGTVLGRITNLGAISVLRTTIPSGGSIVGEGVASWTVGDSNDSIVFGAGNNYWTGNVILRGIVTNDGGNDITINTTTVHTASSAARMGLVVKGVAAQTADLQQWQDSTGTVLKVVTAAGFLGVGIATPTTPLEVRVKDSVVLTVSQATAYYHESTGTPLAGFGTGFILGGIMNGGRRDGAYLQTVFTNTGAGTEAADLRFSTRSAGALATRMTIDSTGLVGIGTTSPAARLHVDGSSDSLKFVVSGGTGQTANLTEWRNSSATILAYVNAAGSISALNLPNPLVGDVGKVLTVTAAGTAAWSAAGGGLEHIVASSTWESGKTPAGLTGIRNTAIGVDALISLTGTSARSTAFGFGALKVATTGNENTALGALALNKMDTGARCVAVGLYALFSTVKDTECVAVGNNTLYTLNGTYGAIGNTAVGHSALTSLIGGSGQGSYNTAVGHSCCFMTYGTANTFIGYYAGAWDGATQQTDNINYSTGIGFGAITTKSNQVVIGDSTCVETLLKGKVGVAGVNPTSTLQVFGSFSNSIVSKNTDYTATASEHTILVDASGAARTITLPAASGATGRVYVIKKTDSSANTVTIDANASETIDGSTTIALSSQYQAVKIQCDGSNWWVIT